MIHVTDIDKQKWDSGSAYKRLNLIFPDLDLTVTESDIYGESMSLTEKIFDGNSELNICGCISSQFSIEMRFPQIMPANDLYPSDGLFPGRIEYTFKGEPITAVMYADDSEPITLFNGYVDSVETIHDRNYIKLTCYDKVGMVQDVNVYDAYAELWDDQTLTVSLKTVRDAIFAQLGITQVSQILVNDTVDLTKNEGLAELAGIDAIRAICELNGVFGLINRDGLFEYRKMDFWYDTEPYPSDNLYPSNDLFPGEISGDNHEYINIYKSLRFEDYVVAPIERVVVRDSAADTDAGESASSGNALLIEGNFLVSGMDSVTKTTIAENVFGNVDYISYRPFEAELRGYPYIEVGDSVSFYSMVDRSVVSFNILTRNLKGIQWLKDIYTADGTMYQPEVSTSEADKTQSEVNQIKNEVKDIEDDIKNLYKDKQNTITLDIQEPTWQAEDADLVFHDNPTTGYRDLFRYDEDHWTKVEFDNRISFVYTEDDDIVPGQSPLASGQIIFVYE